MGESTPGCAISIGDNGIETTTITRPRGTHGQAPECIHLVRLRRCPAGVFDGSARNSFEVVPRVEVQSAFRALYPPRWCRVSSRVDQIVEAVIVEGMGARQGTAHVTYLDGVHTDRALMGAGGTI